MTESRIWHHTLTLAAQLADMDAVVGLPYAVIILGRDRNGRINPASMPITAHDALMRLQWRWADDPAVVLLTDHYAKALMTALRMIPQEMKTPMAQSVMLQVIQDWEDIHAKFEAQLRPPPQKI
jgi:hypothetical protein